MTTDVLKLRAKDAEDIQVISAVLQDSIVPVCDIAFEAETNRFIMVAQRLCREHGEQGKERVCCALTISGVSHAQSHGFNPKDSEKILDLLAIILEPESSLNLIFAGDARIRLDLQGWSGVIEDFGERWPTLCHPCHDNGDQRKA